MGGRGLGGGGEFEDGLNRGKQSLKRKMTILWQPFHSVFALPSVGHPIRICDYFIATEYREKKMKKERCRSGHKLIKCRLLRYMKNCTCFKTMQKVERNGMLQSAICGTLIIKENWRQQEKKNWRNEINEGSFEVFNSNAWIIQIYYQVKNCSNFAMFNLRLPLDQALLMCEI